MAKVVSCSGALAFNVVDDGNNRLFQESSLLFLVLSTGFSPSRVWRNTCREATLQLRILFYQRMGTPAPAVKTRTLFSSLAPTRYNKHRGPVLVFLPAIPNSPPPAPPPRREGDREGYHAKGCKTIPHALLPTSKRLPLVFFGVHW